MRFKEIYIPRDTEIIDTTLREGSQSPELRDAGKEFFRTEDKIAIVEGLIRSGVRFIELFSPIVSPRDAEDFKVIVGFRNKMVQEGFPYVYILAHVRCQKEDAEEALKAGADGLNFYMGTSPESIAGNHGKSLDQVSRIAADLIGNIRRDNPNMPLRFSGEDAFRTRFEDLIIPYHAVADFVDRFGEPDTVGIAKPEEVVERLIKLRKEFPDHDFEGHFHHDRARSLENAIAASSTGLIYMNTSLLGLGERSGITDFSDYMFRRYEESENNVRGYDISLIYSLNVLLASLINLRIPSRLIISATNRTHSAGVHVGAMLKNEDTYESNKSDLIKFGVNQRKLLLGPLSGWHAIFYCLREFLDYDPEEITEKLARDITTEFKDKVHDALEKNPNIKPKDILEAIAHQRKLTKIGKPQTQIETIME